MKLTRQQLTTIIKEELQIVLDEMLSQEEEMLSQEDEDKLTGLCRDPDSVETANLSAKELGYKRPNFCIHMAKKEFDKQIGRRQTRDEARIIDKILKKFRVSAIFTFAEAYAASGLKIETKIEREVLSLVIQNKELEDVINFLKQQVLHINKGLHGGRVKYLTQQNLEEIFQMFNPPKHKTTDYGEGSFSFSAVDQSRERAQMMLMFTKFAPNLKINLLSPIDQQGFDKDDFKALGMNPPTNIEFYGGYR